MNPYGAIAHWNIKILNQIKQKNWQFVYFFLLLKLDYFCLYLPDKGPTYQFKKKYFEPFFDTRKEVYKKKGILNWLTLTYIMKIVSTIQWKNFQAFIIKLWYFFFIISKLFNGFPWAAQWIIKTICGAKLLF